MKKLLIISICFIAVGALSGCHKTCRCIGFDSSITDYDKEDVNNNGGSCSNMVVWHDVRRFSVCDWE